MPKVSIIVPCWNVEKYLDRCVDSLIHQKLEDIEIILVDDKSPDKTPELCDGWMKRDSRIKVIHKPINEGLGMACNSGLKMANGDYIAFCDSDDWVDENMYSDMYNAAIQYRADIVFTGLKRVNDSDNSITLLPHRHNLQILSTKAEIFNLMKDMIAERPEVRNDRTIQMSAKVGIYKKAIISGITFVSEREVPSEDLHFNLHVLANSNIVCILPSYFYNYRVNTNSITGALKYGRLDSDIKCFHYTLQECAELGINGDYSIRCMRMLLGSSRSIIGLVVNSHDSFFNKRKELINICRNRTLREVISKYPISKMPLVHRFFIFAIKHRSIILLFILVKFKSLIKK